MRNLICLVLFSILFIGCSKPAQPPQEIIYAEESQYTVVQKVNENNNYKIMAHSSYGIRNNRWCYFNTDVNSFAELDIGKIYLIESDYYNKIISFKCIGEIDPKNVGHQFRN